MHHFSPVSEVNQLELKNGKASELFKIKLDLRYGDASFVGNDGCEDTKASTVFHTKEQGGPRLVWYQNDTHFVHTKPYRYAIRHCCSCRKMGVTHPLTSSPDAEKNSLRAKGKTASIYCTGRSTVSYDTVKNFLVSQSRSRPKDSFHHDHSGM